MSFKGKHCRVVNYSQWQCVPFTYNAVTIKEDTYISAFLKLHNSLSALGNYHFTF